MDYVDAAVLSVEEVIALTNASNTFSITSALVQAKYFRAIIATTLEPFIAPTITIRIVLDALSNCLVFCVRAIIRTTSKRAIFTMMTILTLALSINTLSICAAMIANLGIDSININKAERVRAVVKSAVVPVVSISASASSQCA